MVKEIVSQPIQNQKLIANKILDLQNGNFTNDKSLKGKHKSKFRKRAAESNILTGKKSILD